MKTTHPLTNRLQAVLLPLTGLLLLSLGGCSAKPEAAVPPVTSSGPRLSDQHFAQVLRQGQEDPSDLTTALVQAFDPGRSVVLRASEVRDAAVLAGWRGLLENERLFDPATLKGIKVYQADTVPAGAPEGAEPDSFFVLFLQWETSPSWTYWLTRDAKGKGKIDRSLLPQHLEAVIRNGLEDKTDLTGEIKKYYNLEAEKLSDPELMEYTLVSADFITDEAKLKTWEAFLTGDESLVPSKVRAVKVYEVKTHRKYQPPRPDNGHQDVGHDGDNSFLTVFFQAKPGEWISWGSYL